MKFGDPISRLEPSYLHLGAKREIEWRLERGGRDEVRRHGSSKSVMPSKRSVTTLSIGSRRLMSSPASPPKNLTRWASNAFSLSVSK